MMGIHTHSIDDFEHEARGTGRTGYHHDDSATVSYTNSFVDDSQVSKSPRSMVEMEGGKSPMSMEGEGEEKRSMPSVDAMIADVYSLHEEQEESPLSPETNIMGNGDGNGNGKGVPEEGRRTSVATLFNLHPDFTDLLKGEDSIELESSTEGVQAHEILSLPPSDYHGVAANNDNEVSHVLNPAKPAIAIASVSSDEGFKSSKIRHSKEFLNEILMDDEDDDISLGNTAEDQPVDLSLDNLLMTL